MIFLHSMLKQQKCICLSLSFTILMFLSVLYSVYGQVPKEMRGTQPKRYWDVSPSKPMVIKPTKKRFGEDKIERDLSSN